jgi:hypothetical protein
MSLENKVLSAITESDLQALLTDKVAEDSQIEFKRELHIATDENKREFLADVTAMANTAGGRILFGVDASGGVASALPGVPDTETDGLVLQVMNLLRDSVKPPIAGLDVHQVICAPGKKVLIIHVPQSFAPPHMITFKGTQRFFARSSNGKHPMEYSEIKTAFLRGATTQEKLDTLRINRLQRVISGTDFRGIDNSRPAFLLEVVPIQALFETQAIGYWDTRTLRAELLPIDSLGSDFTFDFEGFVSFEWNRQTDSVLSYTRLNRAGYVSAYTTSLSYPADDKPTLTSSHFEHRLAEATQVYSTIVQKHQRLLPHAIMISLINAKGLHLTVPRLLGGNRTYHPIQENHLLVHTAMLMEASDDPVRILRPQFDAIWNAFGYSACINYDEHGNWAPHT